MSQGTNFNHKQDNGPVTFSGADKTLLKNNEWVFMDNYDQEGLNKKGDNVEVPENAAIQKRRDSSTLSLHSPFDILHEESELPLGEATLVDKDTNHNSTDDLVDSTDIVDQVSKEVVLLNQISNSKVSDDLNNEPSQTTILI